MVEDEQLASCISGMKFLQSMLNTLRSSDSKRAFKMTTLLKEISSYTSLSYSRLKKNIVGR